jgi:hypothetical protein
MKKTRSVLVLLLLLLGLGVSLAVPAEDVPETAYDESETLPYLSAAVFSITVTHASDRTAKANLVCEFLLHFNSPMKRCHGCRANNGRLHRLSGSPTILNHSLRC